jgi:hypothetical protein
VLDRRQAFERAGIRNKNHLQSGVPLFADGVCSFNDPAALEALINRLCFSS